MTKNKIKISKKLYDKSVVLKACFHYTDDYYLYIKESFYNYVIFFEKKNDSNNNLIEKEIYNTLLEEATRYSIYKQTKNIRDLIVARALSSSEIDYANTIDSNDKYNESILNDWFENEDKNI